MLATDLSHFYEIENASARACTPLCYDPLMSSIFGFLERLVPPSITAASAERIPPASLRLLADGLSTDDITKIGVFLRIGKETLKYDWKLVFAGNAELLCTGKSSLDMQSSAEAMVVRVINSTDNQDSGGTLTRPLQYEPVLDVLRAVERRISAALPVQSLAIPQASYKLRRWPSNALLQKQEHYRRLATFLSAKHITLDNLTLLSNVKRAECETFIQVLDEVGILDVKPCAETAIIVQSAPRPSSPDADTRRGLFGKIRHYLGLHRV
jgi:hypothetical protein